MHAILCVHHQLEMVSNVFELLLPLGSFWVLSDTKLQSEQTISFLASLEVLSRRCQYFIGTYSSNAGRLIAILRAARGWNISTTTSIDDSNQWFYDGQHGI